MKEHDLTSKKVNYIKIGNPIPIEYFTTFGVGQSQLCRHPGSYDEAVKNAGIPDFNIVPYTSLIPPLAKKVEIPDYFFGQRLDAIVADCKGRRCQIITAALGTLEVFTSSGEKVGTLVAEYKRKSKSNDQKIEEKFTKETLKKYLNEMFERRSYTEDFKKGNIKFVGPAILTVKEKFGDAVAAIGFTKFLLPFEGELTPEELKKFGPYLKI